jgi:deoxyribodipyrimidine photo-lyase
MQKKRGIVWFRQDLRVHDNEALLDSREHAQEILPVYVFDERVFKGKTRKYGFPKTGKFRAKFIIECVRDLRESLRRLGSDLIVRVGKPEEILYDLAHKVKSNWVFCNRERTQEEVYVQDGLEKRLWSIGQEMRYSRGKLLYYTSDLPFPITHTPDVFTQFRKEVERYVPVRDPLPVPEAFDPVTVAVDPGGIPTLEDFGFSDFEPDPRGVLSFRGGETAGLERLRYYFWESGLVKTFQKTRNELIGGDFSTKFSPWLAQGCLSPKMIYHELKKFEAQYSGNKSTYGVFFELMWRDFFRFMAKKHGNKIFLKGGIEGKGDPRWKDDREQLNRWMEGRTGVPFIDANMREIKNTGYMSNRGRQNVASFLTKDLRVNWQMGAEYFESALIDYDVASNWGNWQYVAGVGTDPREERYFNIISQANRYDPQGEYIKLWIPELADVPSSSIHQPDQMTFDEQKAHHVMIGADYPKAMVATKRWN